MQCETPDPWITEKSWLTPTDISYDVSFNGFSLRSKLYDIDVSGYGGKSIKLRLFDIVPVDESIVHDGIQFNKRDILHNLTLFLYPDDSDENGRKLYNSNETLRKCVDFMIGNELLSIGSGERLYRLHNELVSKDWFMTFPDFDDYVKTKERMLSDYTDRDRWAEKMIVNIAKAGYFSSDRTISEYNNDIWKLN